MKVQTCPSYLKLCQLDFRNGLHSRVCHTMLNPRYEEDLHYFGTNTVHCKTEDYNYNFFLSKWLPLKV